MIRLFLLLIFCLIIVPQAYALDGCVVPDGKTYFIDEHSECREVENSTGQDIMVPTKAANEWSTGGSSFIDNPPTNVSLSSCTSETSCTEAFAGCSSPTRPHGGSYTENCDGYSNPNRTCVCNNGSYSCGSCGTWLGP